MIARLIAWAATPSSTGWLAFILVSVVTGFYLAWDHRGDKISVLEYRLLQCHGNPEQQKQIERLTETVKKQAKERADEQVQKIEELPNDCYELDDPSPLDRVFGPPRKAPDS